MKNKLKKQLKKLLPLLLLLAAVLLLRSVFGVDVTSLLTQESGYTAPETAAPAVNTETGPAEEPPAWSEADLTRPDEDGVYTGAEEVCAYLVAYGHLPSNYITKSEAQAAGWPGGGLDDYCPGKCIGGDRFGNREGILPKAAGRQYYECDINTLHASSRGAERLVYSNDGLIYYTDDHYESFTLLYGEK